MVTKKDIEDLAKSSEFISGIYNYCDTWCERCQFKGRCANYRTLQIDKSWSDSENAINFDYLIGVLKIAIEILESEARTQGNDLDVTCQKNWYTSNVEHLLSKLTMAYLRNIEIWFEKNQAMFEKYLRNADRRLPLTLVGDDTNLAEPLPRLLEKISRLSSVIHLKIVRALWRSKDIETTEADTYDACGSGKCALVAIDESIAAWKKTQQILPPNQDNSDSIDALERIKLILEQIMPMARNFVRPGIDEC